MKNLYKLTDWELNELIHVLEDIYESFNDYPDDDFYNSYGICYFLKNKYDWSEDKIKELFNLFPVNDDNKHKNYPILEYLFFDSMGRRATQEELWTRDDIKFYDRSKWAKSALNKLYEIYGDKK